MKAFNIRVYGLLINDQNKILVSDEIVFEKKIIKFPGGGLEFGEGAIDCLKREFKEEANLEIEIINHFYTTDFFQLSAYNINHQIVSIYYTVKPIDIRELDSLSTSEKNGQTFRWLNLNSLNESDFSLPIDKKVAELLTEKGK